MTDGRKTETIGGIYPEAQILLFSQRIVANLKNGSQSEKLLSRLNVT